MPRLHRKRRLEADEDGAPAPTQRRPTRTVEESEDEVDEAEQESGSGSGSGSMAQLSKNLVRYALACEYSRTPIRRQDINQKVLGTHSRLFKGVFREAQGHLMDVFGMQMVELPNREKVTFRQKRAAAGADQNKTSNVWILQNILPSQYRSLDCMGPGIAPADENDPDLAGAYIGLYSTVISLILLSGGTLSEAKLDRFLKRMNAGDSTPVDTTDKVLMRMAKDGYIVKIKDTQGGEELVDYMVGPRGKVEVGKEGVRDLVRTVYGDDVQDLDQRLKRSLGLGEDGEDGEAPPVVNGGPVPSVEPVQERSQRRAKPQRGRRAGSDDDYA
ncbi:MAGE-domain-containing protein [Bimuria novae-zelandiae CBS 107.79]|uniref:MAGE-domain-containing protein n=1 Tax=Bimuria novae-zelandiae CBS 107.79 TaxID=1447943 RepID=A0A6A5UR91_9PLEO|nr:MAGE-domain-containing protein [Bimuria novae-zelandiae CBS 107.79]